MVTAVLVPQLQGESSVGFDVFSVIPPTEEMSVDTLNHPRYKYVQAHDVLCWTSVTFVVYFPVWSMHSWTRPLPVPDKADNEEWDEMKMFCM